MHFSVQQQNWSENQRKGQLCYLICPLLLLIEACCPPPGTFQAPSPAATLARWPAGLACQKTRQAPAGPARMPGRAAVFCIAKSSCGFVALEARLQMQGKSETLHCMKMHLLSNYCCRQLRNEHWADDWRPRGLNSLYDGQQAFVTSLLD